MDYYVSKLKELGSNLSILYVEDEDTISREVQILLGKFFGKVSVAKNGEDGLALYKSTKHDIILTDVSMPIMDGLEMAAIIKDINREQIIIIITALTNEKYFKKAIDIGISGFIPKPSEANHIIQSLYEASVRVSETRQNKQYRDRLEQLVIDRTNELITRYVTDELTGLANYQKLKEDITTFKRKSILLLNVDNFESINNSFGVETGDETLREIASSLRMLIPKDAKLYRSNGDEFAILIDNKDTKYAHSLATTIRAYFLENKLPLQKGERAISFTIGIDEGAGIEIVKNAKLAIREVRLLGRDRIQIYNPDTFYIKEQEDKLFWIDRSREAITQELFVPYFQPILENEKNKIAKYECLARMNLATEVISPAKFIEPAKLAGLLSGITRIMVDKSFSFFAEKEGKFSVNIGDYDIKEGYLQKFLNYKSNKYGIDPSRVTLEILETISLQDSKESISQLNELKKMGFTLAIDDFGTENSNFSRLLDIEVDYIKIDGRFIKNLDTDINSQKITTSIVAFARSIGAKVIAEFVHTEAVFKAVKELGIEYSQGYFIGKPNISTELLR